MCGLYLIGITYIGLSVAALTLARPAAAPMCECPAAVSDLLPYDAAIPTAFPEAGGAAQWFQRIKARCNALEAKVALRESPAPSGWQGTGYTAACWGLAGQIDRARSEIMSLSGDERWRTTGIVFEVAHPIADLGDDVSAGPMMELTVEFWPNHYMALYHAGAARFNLKQFEPARHYLERFLDNYHQDDGWTASANSMLRETGR